MLTKKNKQVAVLVSIISMSVFMWGYRIIFPGDKKNKQSQSTNFFQKGLSQLGLGGSSHGAGKTKLFSWGRDPFFAKEIFNNKSKSFILNGILWDEKHPKAVINENIVSIGDKLGDTKVVDIKKDKVILHNGEESLCLTWNH